MSAILQKIRDAVSGKKTIITAVIGLLTAALAWSAGELTDWQALAAAWVAVQIIFIRSGNKRDAENSRSVKELGYIGSYLKGYDDGFDGGLYEDEDGG